MADCFSVELSMSYIELTLYYIVCEGTWFGKRAFFYWDTFMSSSGGFFLEDGTYVGEYALNCNFKDNGGWEGWVCIVYGIPPSD